ncbi:MAG: cache domain-containing protein [Leptolyngbyaceae cyanobacterium MO_188.B28]|nr:cache domain-containing protein [Leptolyngbyaceae cyanobacterium MO_188.B28]
MTLSITERTPSPQKVTLGKQLRHTQQTLGLRTKATVLSVALGALSVLAVGGITHTIVRRSVTEQISQAQLVRTELIAEQVHQFLQARYNEVQLLANHQLLIDSRLRNTAPIAQKEAVLHNFKDRIGFYDSIIFFDVQGKPLFQATTGAPFQGDYGDRAHFQAAVQTQQITVNGPSLSPNSGELQIEYAAPVKDASTGQLAGVLRLRIPGDQMKDLFQSYANHGDEWSLFNIEGKVFAGASKTSQRIGASFPRLPKLHQANQPMVTVFPNHLDDHQKELVSYVPVKSVKGLPDPQLGAMIATETALSFAAERHLLLSLIFGTGAAAVTLGGIAAFMTQRAIRPILAATHAVKKISQGELDTRINIPGQDELGVLGAHINTMVGKLKGLVQEQVLATEKAQLLMEISSVHAPDLDALDHVFDDPLEKIRALLKVDRIVLYRLQSDWSGSIIAEAIASGWPKTLADNPEGTRILEDLLADYQDAPIAETTGVLTAKFNPEHPQLMGQLQIKSDLVLSVHNQGKLAALLIVHHCANPHIWRTEEIHFLQQVSAQLGLAMDRATFIHQVLLTRQAKADAELDMQKQLHEKLERRSLELLSQI